MLTVGGSHDPLLEWAIRESGCGLAYLPEGSAAGLQRFVDGEVVAAAIHLHALDSSSDENIAIMKSVPELQSAALIGFAHREQGIVVARNNPRKLESIRDIAAAEVCVAIRPPGAGAQLLLESFLTREGLDISKLRTISQPCRTGSDIAKAIQIGHADCGITTRSVANMADLDFVRLKWEQFDLVVSQRAYFRPPLQIFFSFLQTKEMRRQAMQVGGYDISVAGQVRYAS